MTAGTFDAGYTLEPNASTMRKMGIATTIEAGVIAHYILGDPNANAFVGGCALTTDFIKSRPDVAKRFTAAWEKAVRLINENPNEARKHLAQEHVHAGRRGRYGADDPLLHGQGPHRQGQGGLPEIHRLLSAGRNAGPRKSTLPSICRRSDRRMLLWWDGRTRLLRADAGGVPIEARPPPGFRRPPTSPSAA